MSALMLFVCGCGDSDKKTQELAENGWYPIDGGYINLRHVKTISSSITNGYRGEFEHSLGAITAENNEKCKNNKLYTTAFIEFDGLKVYLPSANDEESRNARLDSWLEKMKELEKILAEMKK